VNHGTNDGIFNLGVVQVHADFITDLEVALWFLGWHARNVRLIWRRSQCILHALHKQKSTSETFRMRHILNLGPVGMPSINSPTRCRYFRIKNLRERARWFLEQLGFRSALLFSIRLSSHQPDLFDA